MILSGWDLSSPLSNHIGETNSWASNGVLLGTVLLDVGVVPTEGANVPEVSVVVCTALLVVVSTCKGSCNWQLEWKWLQLLFGSGSWSTRGMSGGRV